jgi:hypothetical protein
MPGADPGEGFFNTNYQLFSTDDPAPGAVPTNRGFVVNFKAAIQSDLAKGFKDTLKGTDPSEIMAMYAPEMLPIMSGLAKGFAVCDHWFSSAPTQTIPNRRCRCCRCATIRAATTATPCPIYRPARRSATIFRAEPQPGPSTWSASARTTTRTRRLRSRSGTAPRRSRARRRHANPNGAGASCIRISLAPLFAGRADLDANVDSTTQAEESGSIADGAGGRFTPARTA